MAIKLSAVRDDNIITASYEFTSDALNPDPVDVDVRLIHQSKSANGTFSDQIVKEFIIPADNFQIEGLGIPDSPIKQTASVKILNPRYINNLFLEASETRDGSPITTRVPILKDITSDESRLVNNPIDRVEHPENRPPLPKSKPEDNVSEPQPELKTTLYDLSQDGIELLQSGKKIVLNELGRFIEQDYNEKVEPLLIENSSTNYALNPSLIGDQIPDNYDVEATGFTFNSDILDGEITNTNVWQLRFSNSSLLNAFAPKIKYTQPQPIAQGLNDITASTYYRLWTASTELPFQQLSFEITYYDSNDNEINTDTQAATVQLTRFDWKLANVTFTNIPFTATKYSLALVLSSVEITELFQIQIYLPQVEPGSIPTSRMLESRIQDKYQTPEVELSLPLYFKIRTQHYNAPSRGLLGSAVHNKDGIVFFNANNKLYYRQYDPNGTLLASATSSSISINDGADVSYGLFLTDTTAEFYVDNALLSSHSVTNTLDQTKSLFVGSLGNSGTAMNTQLIDAGIFRDKP